jgi:chromate transporter
MNIVVLFLLLLKATLVSFSGLASLPIVRSDLVVHYRVLTDRQLNTAVAVSRAGPGPNGLYLVSVGYFVKGYPGAVAGVLAMITPAFLIIILLRWLGARAERPRAKSIIQALILAGAGLILSATVPLARDAVTGPGTFFIALASFLILAGTRIDTVWVIAGSAVVGLLMKVAS